MLPGILSGFAARGQPHHGSTSDGIKPWLPTSGKNSWLVLGGAWINHLVPRML